MTDLLLNDVPLEDGALGRQDAVLPEQFTDADLAALALAADPDEVLAAGAVPLSEVMGSDKVRLLPDWYMPAPMARTRLITGWRRKLVFALVVAFLLIDAAGLCFTYGEVVIASVT